MWKAQLSVTILLAGGVQEYEHAKRRGATIYAEVRGYGLSAEASHITAPVSDGNGSHR